MIYELCIIFCTSSGLFGQSPQPESPPLSAVGFKFPGQCITAGECSCYVARSLQPLWGSLILIKDITFRFPDYPQFSCKGRFSSHSILSGEMALPWAHPLDDLLGCPWGFCWSARAQFTNDCEGNEKSSWLSKQEDANLKTLHMSLKTSTTALSLHCFLAPAWPDGKLISSPSSSYAKSLPEKWICVPFFLLLPGAAVKSWQQRKACAYVPCRALKLWKSKCWVYISLLWMLVMRC